MKREHGEMIYPARHDAILLTLIRNGQGFLFLVQCTKPYMVKLNAIDIRSSVDRLLST